MNWLLIVGLIILAFIFVKIKDLKHKTFLVFIIIILLFFYTTGASVLRGENIEWSSASGVESGLKLYFSWLGSVFTNFKEITTNAVRMDWSTKNETIQDIPIEVIEKS